MVGSNDLFVRQIIEKFRELTNAETKTMLIPWASHLLEEEGILNQVSRIAVKWFNDKLTAS